MTIIKSITALIAITTLTILNAKTLDCSGLSYEKIKKSFQLHGALGLETQFDLTGCNIERMRTAAIIKDYLIKVTKLNAMRLQEQPVINHFSDGAVKGYAFSVTTAQGIIWGRCINQTNRMLITLFCLHHYDPALIAELTQKQFGASDCTVHAQLKV